MPSSPYPLRSSWEGWPPKHVMPSQGPPDTEVHGSVPAVQPARPGQLLIAAGRLSSELAALGGGVGGDGGAGGLGGGLEHVALRPVPATCEYVQCPLKRMHMLSLSFTMPP